MSTRKNLAALVDELAEQYPAFRRTTIERLVARIERSLQALGGRPTLFAIAEEAREQLDYVQNGAGRAAQAPGAGVPPRA